MTKHNISRITICQCCRIYSATKEHEIKDSVSQNNDKTTCLSIVLSSLAAHKKQHDKCSPIHEQMNVIGLNRYDGSFKVLDLHNCSKVLIWCSRKISDYNHIVVLIVFMET